MAKTKKILLIALPLVLLAAVVVMLSYDTFAAYFASLSETGAPMYAKNINFHINGSESNSITLDALSIEPDEGDEWTVTLDARGTEFPIDAQMNVDVNWNGNWPKGLNVYLEDEQIDPSEGATLSFDNIQNTSPHTVRIRFYWDVSSNAAQYNAAAGGHVSGCYVDRNGNMLDLSEYNGFNISATVDVNVFQPDR